MKLENEVRIVTGGSRGIGKAIAFALQTAHPVLGFCTLCEVEAPALKARGRCPQPLAMKVDVCKRQEVEATVASTLAELGRIDILVDNASIHPPVGPLWGNDPDEWPRTNPMASQESSSALSRTTGDG